MSITGKTKVNADFYLQKIESKHVPWLILKDESVTSDQNWQDELSCIECDVQPLPLSPKVSKGEIIRVQGTLTMLHHKYSTDSGSEYDTEFLWDENTTVKVLTKKEAKAVLKEYDNK